MKKRIFNIMQYELHPETKEPLLNEEKIIDALNHRSIKRWAYIAHEKDKNEDGTIKPKHWHIVLETGKNPVEIDTIAKWFGILPNYVNVPSGYGAFLDCVEYLTHEREEQQKKGKYRYADEEVKANFDFRDALNKKQERRLKYKRDLTDKEAMRLDVLVNGKTLIQCYEENPLLYSEDMDKLKKLRLQYLHNQKPPKTRINYYIHGSGGQGKGLCSRALARSLFPDITEDDELFFIVGNGNATFEGYDGQPVIIWDDMRAIDLLKTLGSRGNVFNVFDTHPTKQRQNIKYGSINLTNKVNIVNSVQYYIDFLDGLAGEYKTRDGEVIKSEDKKQSYRRIPFIISLHEEDFDLLCNRGFMKNNADFEDFDGYYHIRGNFQKTRVLLGDNEKKAIEVETGMHRITKQKYDEAIEQEEQKRSTKDIDEIFKDYGKIIEPVEEVVEEDCTMNIPDDLAIELNRSEE